MGIQGLLPLLKGCIKEQHISAFRGKRVAIDGYSWLHKGTYGCCVDLANGIENYSWIKYCLYFIDMLLSFDIHITLVFDGADLPAKLVTEVERREKRESALAQARQLTRAGDKKTARTFFSRCVNVTGEMAAKLIAVVRAKYPVIKVVVAPYEADAQLAYLSQNDLVDIIISEDSDTIAYQCKEMIFKLEHSGNCQHLVSSDIFSLPEFGNFTPDMLTLMCIAAGCDYLPSVKGFAVKTSLKYVEKYKTCGALLRAMRLENLLPLNFAAVDVSPDLPPSLLVYELEYFKALLTFKHQVVFDPITRQTRHLSPIGDDTLGAVGFSVNIDGYSFNLADTGFLGSLISDDYLAQSIADGLADPQTGIQFPKFTHIPPYLVDSARPQQMSRSVSTHSFQQQSSHTTTSASASAKFRSTSSNSNTNLSASKPVPEKGQLYRFFSQIAPAPSAPLGATSATSVGGVPGFRTVTTASKDSPSAKGSGSNRFSSFMSTTGSSSRNNIMFTGKGNTSLAVKSSGIVSRSSSNSFSSSRIESEEINQIKIPKTTSSFFKPKTLSVKEALDNLSSAKVRASKDILSSLEEHCTHDAMSPVHAVTSSSSSSSSSSAIDFSKYNLSESNYTTSIQYIKQNSTSKQVVINLSPEVESFLYFNSPIDSSGKKRKLDPIEDTQKVPAFPVVDLVLDDEIHQTTSVSCKIDSSNTSNMSIDLSQDEDGDDDMSGNQHLNVLMVRVIP